MLLKEFAVSTVPAMFELLPVLFVTMVFFRTVPLLANNAPPVCPDPVPAWLFAIVQLVRVNVTPVLVSMAELSCAD